MRIDHICVRCRHEFGTVEIHGGHPALMPFMLPSASPKMCPHCGGSVYPVTDEETLPFEFVPSSRRVLEGAIWSAATSAVLWTGFGIGIQTLPSDPQAVLLFPRWLWRFPAIGGVFAFLLAWLIAKMRRPLDVNAPHRKGSPSPAEFGSLAPLFLPIVGLFVALFVWGAPMLTSGGLQAGWIRGLIGAFAAFATSGNTLRQVFKNGRRPPVPGKRWRFGEEPT